MQGTIKKNTIYQKEKNRGYEYYYGLIVKSDTGGRMVDKNICISVLGIQNIGNGLESILTKASGTYDFENGFHVINYRELDEHGTATDNILFLSEKEMQLNKSGSLSGKFHFGFGKKTLAKYFTPFGKVDFQVETEFYKLSVETETINVQLIYKLYTDGQLFLENMLSIHIESDIDNVGLADK